ncbi:unconventional myosin-IXb-like isoform X1 [Sinocyclocheilus anshuiensis]|uniref:unconventional myosin-IXb-like isoform X1 n=1 Tax=Sinocyclocheilus anshuiensis TaxID=1608454 RepID=UPI0007B8A4DE|nr:PREDICTED: unconventional myosin-IXb-like isoform X1 [Sinocyclocheilus anshuiensis]XP_016303816.1 PREDICTED: unconventional myosin-IXb-like isoform X1 [Sinocyclocheilus anshuiensis]XP_016303818.1 PREDICTED: unconventional myosin-IXb-like isoform X1 [Sinocyclocheilus anshuiensis]
MNVMNSKVTSYQDEAVCTLQIYPRFAIKPGQGCILRVPKEATATTVIKTAVATLGMDTSKPYILVEVQEYGGEEWVLQASDQPVQRVLLWPRKAQDKHPQSDGYFFALQEGSYDGSIQYDVMTSVRQEKVAQGLANRGFVTQQPQEYDDLCNLPELTEESILGTLRHRFHKQKIYTFASNILIAVNPFKFLPIYNPRYVKMYENHTLGKLEPHVFAIADAAFHTMLNKQVNQCIVISGESGSGKTQSTNFLIHCLTALSQKGYTSGVERTILGAGPVLEAFGNAKTAYNNNSSRFGKFIQVNYLESGVVRGAVVEKYLLEKCRLVSRGKTERNYHVFYYLLIGASEEEKDEFKLLRPEEYHYLKEEIPISEDQAEMKHEFRRLHQAMEMVGFLPPTKKQIFSVLSAILYLGNVTYEPKVVAEGLKVGPDRVLSAISDLLKVKVELLVEALTTRKAMTANDTLILPYSLSEAITARDSMAKSLYSALFDWIVLRINHALLNKIDLEESVPCLSIGVLDIFGFEDFKTNSFEQFCINYANEQLQYYCNQCIFKLEQEEYMAEGIIWHNIDYPDNIGCISLFSKKPTGLFYLLDEESNFPQATDSTLLEKFKQQHQNNPFFVQTPVRVPAFVIRHFAGKVKYQIKDFREKNTDHMRPDIVALLRSSECSYLRQLIGANPVAVFRWGILRATIRTLAVFNEAGRSWAEKHPDQVRRYSRHSLGEMKRPSTVVDRLKSQGALIDFSFDRSEEGPLEAFEDIFATFENKKELHAKVLQSLKQFGGEVPQKLRLSTISVRKSRLFFQKNRPNRHKQLIPKNLIDSHSLKFIMGLTQHNRATRSLLRLHTKKKPPSISTQFQASLSKLLETLRKAEPFFVRCIRSNGDKREMHFDDALVLQQLRYTSMLQTVRIRMSGYGAKFTFKEFTDQFRVLLPKEISTPQQDITNLLTKMGLPSSSFQIGRTKVFLKESERQILQEALHKEVMRSIIILQRWFRACLMRKQYLREREGIITIQRSWRYLRQTYRSRAAIVIQTAWRRSKERAEYLKKRENLKAQISQTELGQLNKTEEKKPSLPKPQPLLPDESCTPERKKTEELSPQSNTGTKPKVTIHPTRITKQLSINEDQLVQDDKDYIGNKERQPSPAGLPRPVSLPLNMSQSGSDKTQNNVHLQCHNRTTRLKEKPEKWKERRREVAHMENVSAEMLRLQSLRKSGLRTQSLDNVSRMSSSESDSSSSSSKNEIQSPVESEGCISITRRTSEVIAPSSTPERRGFLKYFKRRLTPQDGNVTMAKTLAEKEELASGSHSYSPRVKNSATFPGPRRNPTIKISRATRVQEKWNASLDREITDSNELHHLDEFLGNQMNDLSTRSKVLSETEKIFFLATTQFRDTIKSMYSISNPNIGYKDLMSGYQKRVASLAGLKKASEVPLVVNLFQSVLDGFIRGELKRLETEPCKVKERNRRKSKRDKCPDGPLGHLFSTYQVTIMQSCDQCSSYIWGMEKAFMCSSCKMVCHKKCLSKITVNCTGHCDRKKEGEQTLHFGVPLCALVRTADSVPFVMEKMLVHVEMNGLYTEGIYRKSGSACRAKELHHILEKDPQAVSLDNYPIHTITGLVKLWLRELPDPLMTYSLYNDFLYAADLPEASERLRAIYRKLDELPPSNFSTLERLIFHLVKVAKEEAHNRMSANALAILFAPCILRCPDSSDPLLSMKDINKTTLCVEILINEQTRCYNQKMEEIQQLENAEAMAINQLKLRRQSTIFERPKLHSDVASVDKEFEKNLLERIKSIKKEKNELAFRLPEFEQDSSDAENMDSESLVSSESLLEDHFVSLNSEANTGFNSSKPEKPAKPPDPTRDPKTGSKPPAEELSQNRSASHRDGVQSMCVIQSQDVPESLAASFSAGNQGKRRFSDLDIPFIDEDV